MSTPTPLFGLIPELCDHYVAVNIPTRQSANDVITIAQVYAVDSTRLCLEREDRPCAQLTPDQWAVVGAAARVEFINRQKGSARGGRKLSRTGSTWKKGENIMPLHLGKELVVLAWAVEDAHSSAEVSVAVQNWFGLAPEERWWLFTTAHAGTGHYLKEAPRHSGWRKAIKIALAAE